MSSLKLGLIQDATTNNSSTPEQMYQGRAKAWVNFDGTGTVAIRDSFNVASLTDHGTGDYSITFDEAMASADYVVTAGATGDIASANTPRSVGASSSNPPTTSVFRFFVTAATIGNIDVARVMIAIFGDQ
jgi:hypothetical protein